MKRYGLTVLTALAGLACGFPAGLTNPTGAAGTPGGTFSAAATCPSTSPSSGPLPFATFGRPQGASGCPSAPPNILTPSFSFLPASGTAPLKSEANMCGSSDTDPAITLHYAVDYGDGGSDGSQSSCRFPHTYTGPGTFTAQECVWDEIPAHAPGQCKKFTVSVTTTCSVSFSDVSYCGNVTVLATTQGSSAACGNPLILQAVAGDLNQTLSQTCSASDSRGCFFNFFGRFNTSLGRRHATGSDAAPQATVTGVNAAGSITIPLGTGCDD